MRSTLRRLHEDSRGQIVPLFLLGLVTLVLLVVMLINTGQEVVRRTEVQNGADAAAITQASWAASSLNVMAMNNVGMTQALAISVVSAALNETILFDVAPAVLSLARTYIMGAASACPNIFAIALCAYYVGAGIHLAVTVAVPTIRILAQNPFGAAMDFRQVAIAFSKMNEHIARSFPLFSDSISRRVASANGVEAPIFYPEARGSGRQLSATPLPVETSWVDFPQFPLFRLCSASAEGTRRDLLGVVDLFENYAEHGYRRGEGPYPVAKAGVDGRISGPLSSLGGFPHRFHYRTPQPQRRGDNEYTRLLDQRWPLMCRSQMAPAPVAVAALPWPPRLSMYRILDRPRILIPFRSPPQRTRDTLSVVAVTRRRGGAAVVSDRFRNPPETAYGYAQAEVYTDQTAHDLFTQDWRARLVPARLMETKRTDIARSLQPYPNLERLIGALSARDLGEVNAH